MARLDGRILDGRPHFAGEGNCCACGWKGELYTITENELARCFQCVKSGTQPDSGIYRD